ncbi:hypothetical protein HY030_02475 [Candidatus Gottesmanbacteria bacterium]|nr:hypothetical protein [Candidatus Gottesmanbacteria bacterium]
MIHIIKQIYAVNIDNAFTLGERGNMVSRTFPTLSAFIFPLIKNAFVLAGIILILLLVFGGIMYLVNAGSGDKEGLEKSKNALTTSILGFIIIFAAFWIIQIIQFITKQDILNSNL